MSAPLTLEPREPLPWRRRSAALLAVTVARVLAWLPPRRIRRALCLLRRGAVPATAEQALTARQAVVTVSVRCAGQGCLQRSLATVVLCRMGGVWPTWCTGVRMRPFSAHAWVEVDGQPIGEPYPAGFHHRIMTVPSLVEVGQPSPPGEERSRPHRDATSNRQPQEALSPCGEQGWSPQGGRGPGRPGEEASNRPSQNALSPCGEQGWSPSEEREPRPTGEPGGG